MSDRMKPADGLTEIAVTAAADIVTCVSGSDAKIDSTSTKQATAAQTTVIASEKGGSMYKTPQELFSSFKIPDMSDCSNENVEEKPTSSSQISAVNQQPTIQFIKSDLPIVTELTKHRKIQPNIRIPASQPISSPATYGNTPILQALPAMFPQIGHRSPLQSVVGQNGPVYYVDPMMYGYPQPSLFGYPGFFYGMQPGFHAMPRLSTALTNKTASELLPAKIPARDESSKPGLSSSISQYFANVQSQMAAAHIPLCLVQDGNGKLHQLVYTVPAHLYEQYIKAATNSINQATRDAAKKQKLEKKEKCIIDSKSRSRKREKFYMFSKAKNRRKDDLSLNEKDFFLRTVIKRTSEKSKQPFKGLSMLRASEQSKPTPLPKIYLPLGKKTEPKIEHSSTDRSKAGSIDIERKEPLRTVDAETNTEDDVKVMETTIAPADSTTESPKSESPSELVVAEENKIAAPSPTKSSSAAVGEEINVSCFSNQNQKDPLQRLVDTIDLNDSSNFSVKPMPNSRLGQGMDIDNIINPITDASSSTAMEDLLERLKTKLKEVEASIASGTKYERTLSEPLPEISRQSPQSVHSPQENSDIDSRAMISDEPTFSPVSDMCDMSNEVASIISDFNSPQGSSAGESISSASGFGSSPDYSKCMSLETENLNSPLLDAMLCSSASEMDIETDLIESAMESDFVSEEFILQNDFDLDLTDKSGPRKILDAKFFENLKDNFFGCDNLFSDTESMPFDVEDLNRDDSPVEALPHSSDSDFNFLDRLIDGL